MKKFFTLIFTSLFFLSSYPQQPADPFNWTEPIIIPNSIYVLWSGGENSSSLNPSLNVYFSSSETHTIQSLREDSLNAPEGSVGKVYFAVLDLDNNGTDELIGAWEQKDSTVSLNLLSPNYHYNIPLDGKLVNGNGEQKWIYVIPGDFDGDHSDEFIVGFIDDQKKINLRLYDSDGTLKPELVSSISDEDLSGNPLSSIRFALMAGDYDQNGDDELALVSYDADNDPAFETGLYIKIYDVSNAGFVPKAKQVVLPEATITTGRYMVNTVILAGATVPGYGGEPDKLAAAFTTIEDDSPNYPDTWLITAKTSSDLNSLIFDENKAFSKHYNSNYIPSLQLVSGDLDNDLSADLVFIRSGSFDIYGTDEDLNLPWKTGGGFPTSNNGDDLRESYDFAQITDLDNEPGEELITVKNIWSNDMENRHPQGFSIRVYGDTAENISSFSLKSSGEHLTEIPYEWPYRTFALAAGNFEKSKVTIQAPRYSHRSDISHPIVVLNAPPVHFDSFNGEIFDINSCYNGGTCNFFSTYTKSITETSELTTTVQSSWDATAGLAREGSIGVNVEESAEPLGVGASVTQSYSENFEYHLLANYGEHFENTSSNKQTQTVQLDVSAIEDDQIFANITDYDIWEYPYFIGNHDVEDGVIVVFRPTNSEARWFPSKSVSGSSYQPIHEPGNILSYYSYDSIHNNPDVFQDIQSANDISTPTFTLSANSKYSWSLTKSNFDHNGASNSVQFGVDAGAMGFGFKAEFNQSNSYLYTQSTSVADEIKLSVDIGGINRSIGPTEYRITPYAYWSKKGALVIDYSVEPEVDLQGGSTWWQEKYGNRPDPAIILPWRLDPEKGFAISNESKRSETKDIRMKPTFISPGDTAIITANVRNFSLVNTSSPVKVRFYLGNPSAGGQLLEDIYGTSEFLTDGNVPARGLKTVSFVWASPKGVSLNRLYMVLDPDQSIDEVHEENNTGWIPLSTSATDVPAIPVAGSGDLELFRNYPNPFSDMATVKFYLGRADDITLNIYDVSGKLLRSYHPGIMSSGVHTIEIEGNGFATGVYYYTLRGQSSGSRTGKMMVVK